MEIIKEESRLQALTAEKPELHLELREIDVWPMVERLTRDCQSIADLQRVRIHNDVPHDLVVHADPDLLVEVLQNLLSNALKYTSDGEIVVGGEHTDNAIVCWVTDTGVGIPPDKLKLIFQERAGDPNVPESTGLGLAVVEKTMRLHRGRITVDSKPGRGSTFRVEFPKDPATHP
jgi:signal transduction histidine kinase